MPKIVPELVISDMNRSMDFYSSLGFVQGAVGIIDEKGSQWYSVTMGESEVQLLRQDILEGFDADKMRGHGVNLYLTVGDVDGMYDKLKAGGAKIVQEIETAWYGLRQFGVADPDGYVWTINMPVDVPAKDAAEGQDPS